MSDGAPASPVQIWRPIRLGLVASALLALLLRELAAYKVLSGSPLNSDLPGFVESARSMRFFWDAGFREPLHALWIKIGLWLAGEVEPALRLVTLVQTLGAALVVYLVGARTFGRPVALVALGLFVFNPVVRFYGVAGLRAPLFTALLLGFMVLLFHPWAESQRRRGAVLAGLAASALVLTRVHGWIIVVGGLLLWLVHARIWRAETRRPALWHAAIVLGLAVALFAPYQLLNDGRTYSEPANFWRNIELTGAPGDFRHAPPISTLDYVFENRGLVEVVGRVLSNYLLYARFYLPHFLGALGWLAWLLPLGIALALWRRRAYVVGMLLLSIAQVVFILHLNPVAGARGIESRFVYQAFPLALWLILVPLGWGLAWLAGWLARRWPERSGPLLALRAELLGETAEPGPQARPSTEAV